MMDFYIRSHKNVKVFIKIFLKLINDKHILSIFSNLIKFFFFNFKSVLYIYYK